MLISEKLSLMKRLNAMQFLDPDKCTSYIGRASVGQQAVIHITDIIDDIEIGPYSMQIIILPIKTTDDEKLTALGVEFGYFDFHMIMGGWRFRLKGEDNIEYRFAGGSHDGRNANIPVSSDKINFIVDSINGICTINGSKVQDLSTIPIPNQKYVMKKSDRIQITNKWEKLTYVDIFGIYDATYTEGNFKFYGMKVWDSTGKLVFHAMPYVLNGVAGVYEYCTKTFHTRTHNSGSFIFGND